VASASSSTSGAGAARVELRELRAIDDVPTLLGELATRARGEDFAMLDRLVAEWRSARGRFDAPGERLLAVVVDGTLVAVGGITRDPWSPAHVGRIRRLYVDPEHRGRGLGALVLADLVRGARATFGELHLRTTTERGAAFFEACGFAPIDAPEATHALQLHAS
jgi:GNAT superfamily N-acetyltransferase